MRILVTGSAGYLGDALVRTLPKAGHEVVGVGLADSRFTQGKSWMGVRDMASATCLTNSAQMRIREVLLHACWVEGIP